MTVDTFDLPGLARYLNRDARSLEKLAARGRLPGRRVAGGWRFRRDEVHRWLEHEIPTLSEKQLVDVEITVEDRESPQAGFVVSRLMVPQRMAVPLEARTAPAVLARLVELANADWQVYDPARILATLKEREAIGTTALAGGIALPHPGRPQTDLLGESLVAFGRTTSGIPFGAPLGGLTDLFFLILCQSADLHLQVLARLSRMFQRPAFLDELRAAQHADDAFDAVCRHERSVLA